MEALGGGAVLHWAEAEMPEKLGEAGLASPRRLEEDLLRAAM